MENKTHWETPEALGLPSCNGHPSGLCHCLTPPSRGSSLGWRELSSAHKVGVHGLRESHPSRQLLVQECRCGPQLTTGGFWEPPPPFLHTAAGGQGPSDTRQAAGSGGPHTVAVLGLQGAAREGRCPRGRQAGLAEGNGLPGPHCSADKGTDTGPRYPRVPICGDQATFTLPKPMCICPSIPSTKNILIGVTWLQNKQGQQK